MRPADLARRGEAARLAELATATLGEVHVLINNAGATMQGLAWVGGDRDEVREVLETKLWSPLGLAAMLERGRGAIVNVGSMAAVARRSRHRPLCRIARHPGGGHAGPAT